MVSRDDRRDARTAPPARPGRRGAVRAVHDLRRRCGRAAYARRRRPRTARAPREARARRSSIRISDFLPRRGRVLERERIRPRSVLTVRGGGVAAPSELRPPRFRGQQSDEHGRPSNVAATRAPPSALGPLAAFDSFEPFEYWSSFGERFNAAESAGSGRTSRLRRGMPPRSSRGESVRRRPPHRYSSSTSAADVFGAARAASSVSVARSAPAVRILRNGSGTRAPAAPAAPERDGGAQQLGCTYRSPRAAAGVRPAPARARSRIVPLRAGAALRARPAAVIALPPPCRRAQTAARRVAATATDSALESESCHSRFDANFISGPLHRSF
ncbi:hypothetical protein EVAR_96635_1 [Eumeta japonica]|uniref:Uncharacterized protein n=1 Tax=Eumeta variegata TaxID=151549 RepID=A0A4C1WV20_EUMVA|nr:hypothetical protein EVAR_96635_1 [Eumeta japonica]